MMKKLDFSNPIQGRKWLRLLQDDPDSGIRILPSLCLPENSLGFSFTSNRFGLRGPCDQSAGAVVLGTSYAMGFAVDNGQNWYEGLLGPDKWFNAGLPVGPMEWHRLLDSTHCAKRKLALLLYHPNIWSLGISYAECRRSGKKPFDYFKWRTGYSTCLMLYLRREYERYQQRQEGLRVDVVMHGARWVMDANYSLVDCSKMEHGIREVTSDLLSLLQTFERVICVRLPIKEQLIPEIFSNVQFGKAKTNYEEMWEHTKASLCPSLTPSIYELNSFSLGDYHGADTHLNTQGNRRLRQSLKEIIKTEGFGSLCL